MCRKETVQTNKPYAMDVKLFVGDRPVVDAIMLVFVLLSFLVYSSHAELFTAVVDLERILHAEHNLAQDLRSYVEREQQRIDILKRMADDFEQHSSRALRDPEKHLSNPVNAFLVVKRFTSDWDHVIDTYIRTNATDEFLEHLTSTARHFPSQEDLTGVAVAFLRLQDTYALSTEQLATGDVEGITDTSSMTAEDCYELGRLAYNEADYYHTVLWMKEALHRLDDTSQTMPSNMRRVERSVVLDYLAYAMFMHGNVREALKLTNELLDLEPLHVRAKNNRRYYEEILAENGDTTEEASAEIKRNRPNDDYRNSEEFVTYEKLCRGEKTHHYKYEKMLTCQYRRHHPLFYLRPLKEEVMYLSPRITIFHDLLTDRDMDTIRRLATPRLNRATVQNAVTGKLETANYRVSKSAWLRDDEDERVMRVSDLSRALLNLTLDTVEELQVVNYGIGGHYEPHYDFARRQEKNAFEQWRGNRVATFLCYMSDVEAGGATVFPEIGVRLVPEKGACTTWYNLLLSGEGDYDTRHAACPVLFGSKWVCNKWFHERGQEFIRPCSLSSEE